MSINNIGINFINDNEIIINEGNSAATGDNLFLIIFVAICVGAYVFLIATQIIKALNIGKQSLTKKVFVLPDNGLLKHFDPDFITTFVIYVIAAVEVILLCFLAVFANNNIAYAGSVNQNIANTDLSFQADTPESIIAHVNNEFNVITCDSFEIKNNKENNFYFNKITLKDSSRIDTSNWKITCNGKVLYDNVANQQNSLCSDCVCIKANSSITINIDTDMSSDFAKQYVSSDSPYSIELVFDTIPDTHQHAIEPNVLSSLIYNGQQQEGVVANDTINFEGDFVAKDAGEYKVYCTPKDGYLWDDATQNTKEYNWSIARATSKLDLSSQTAYLDPFEEITTKIFTLGDGELCAKIEDENTASIVLDKDAKSLKIIAVAAGQTKINLSIAETNNTTSASVIIPVVVGQYFTGKAYGVFDSKHQSDINIKFNFNPFRIVNLDNNTYNPDLAYLTASFINDSPADLGIDLDGYDKWDKTNNIKLYEVLQMSDIEEHVSSPDDYQTDKDDVLDVILSHKKFKDQDANKELVLITIQNSANAEIPDSWYSNFDIGCDCDVYNKYQHPDWLNVNNHKGFDIAFNRIKNVIDVYIAQNVDTSSQVSVLLTAHSRSAAVCNLLSQDYSENTNYKVFSYCYATPNPEISSSKKTYPNIITIQNDDDMIPYVPLKQWGFAKYSDGNHYGINIADEGYRAKWEQTSGTDYKVMDPIGEGGIIPSLYNNLSKTREGLYEIKDKGIYEGGGIGMPTEFDSESEAEEAKLNMISELAQTSLDKYQDFKVVKTEEGKYSIDINMSPSFTMAFVGRLVNKYFVTDSLVTVMFYYTKISSYVIMPSKYTLLLTKLLTKGSAIYCSHSQYSYYFVVDQFNNHLSK